MDKSLDEASKCYGFSPPDNFNISNIEFSNQDNTEVKQSYPSFSILENHIEIDNTNIRDIRESYTSKIELNLSNVKQKLDNSLDKSLTKDLFNNLFIKEKGQVKD
jgi:hypothetical protein